MKAVGVFRDAPVAELVGVASEAGLDAVQLHGRENAQAVRAQLPAGIEVWAACAVNGSAPAARRGADRSLFDGPAAGSGETFDWSLLAGRDDLPAAFLAGGIGPANAKAAAAVGAFGLDVGSRVECAAGVKDPAKVAELFAALRPPARSAPC